MSILLVSRSLFYFILYDLFNNSTFRKNFTAQLSTTSNFTVSLMTDSLFNELTSEVNGYGIYLNSTWHFLFRFSTHIIQPSTGAAPRACGDSSYMCGENQLKPARLCISFVCRTKHSNKWSSSVVRFLSRGGIEKLCIGSGFVDSAIQKASHRGAKVQKLSRDKP